MSPLADIALASSAATSSAATWPAAAWSAVAAFCSFVTAVVALCVSIKNAKATRLHHRQSVRPILQFTAPFRVGKTAGLRLRNIGFGPAEIIVTKLTFDGELLGEFNEINLNKVANKLSHVRPFVRTWRSSARYLAKDFARYPLSVRDFDPQEHEEFKKLIRHRIKIEIRYKSLYGEEQWIARHPRQSEEDG
jgi:hypothetical protein